MKNIKSNIYLGVGFLIISILFSCGHKHSHGDGHNHDHGSEEHGAHDGHNHGGDHADGEIFLTKDQIETMDIQFGDFSSIKINDFVKATGTLDLPPNAYAAVSARADGFIRGSKKYVEGSYIKKGAIIAYLENPEFIQKQQSYLEVQSELIFLNQELARQQKLLSENAGIEKKVQQLQSEVNAKTATVKGTAKQLAYLGINTSNLTPENITERIAIVSPMSGYITSVNLHNGMYVSPQMELMEIVNENHLHLELDIFEKDISKIKEKQKISYTVPAMSSDVYEGEVHIIGKEFNTQNKTVRVHGHLEQERPKFIKDLFVDAKIWLNDQTVNALPEKAIIKDGDFSYIYVADENENTEETQFHGLRILVGRTEDNFTQVSLIDTIPEGMKIVTKGSYFVFAQSKAGELSHEH